MIRWVLLVAACWSALALAQDAPLDDFEQFKSYPYLDRGYRLARQENWPEVETLMRHLLTSVPANDQARRLLVEALIHQHRFAAAESQIARLTDGDGEELRAENRLAWVDAGQLPSATRIESWLAGTSGERRERLWTAYSQQLAERQGDAAALDWLLAMAPRSDEVALRRRRSILAESLGRWSVVVDQLAVLRDDQTLAEDDWRRLAVAYLQRDNTTALKALLVAPPNVAAAQDMLDAASERAIAANQPELAEQWLLQRQSLAPLNVARQRRLLEVARQSGDIGRVINLSHSLGESCLGLVQWLMPRDAARARQQLARCVPSENYRSWLVLAQDLAATELLESTTLPAPWNAKRRQQLVALWQQQGQPQRALDWLGHQAQTVTVLALRAQLLQAKGEWRPAAHAWIRLYRQTGRLEALDQASFLVLKEGDVAQARNWLEAAFDHRRGQLSPSLLGRLASLYSRASVSVSPARAERLITQLTGNARGLLLVRLASDGQCAIVHRHAGKTSTLAVTWRALGLCAMPDRPGAAVVFYRHALEQGDTASRKPLAYALQSAGNPAAAYRLWHALPVSELDNAARLAAARSALRIGENDAAVAYWTSSEHESAEAWQLGANIALAQRRPEVALQRQRRALALDVSGGRFYAAASNARAAGEDALARDWLHESVKKSPDNPQYRADYALRLAGNDDAERRHEAVELLEQSVEAYPEDFRLHDALALRYTESGDNDAARRQLRGAIDLEQVPLAVGRETAEQVHQRRYRQRRLHETLSRRDNVTLSSTWSPASPSAGIRSSGGEQNTQVIQWDHALGKQPITDGRQVSVYGRTILNSDSYSRYGQSVTAGVGLRVKPFTRLNLNLYSEVTGESQGHAGATLGDIVLPWRGQTSSDTTSQQDVDLLLRASASFFDQGEYRNDWRVGETHWNERSLYLGAAWWVRDGEHQVIARYRQGHSFKLPVTSAQTLMPYAMLQATTQETQGWQEDTRLGLGLRWQYWFDADRYNAYRGQLTLRVEYQQAVGGTLYDQNDGWLSGIEVSF